MIRFAVVFTLVCLASGSNDLASVSPIGNAIEFLLNEVAHESRFTEDENMVVRSGRTFLSRTEVDDVTGPRKNVEETVMGHPEVEIESGIVIGSKFPEAQGFFSIPFGKSPEGPRRFMPPEKVDPFSEPYNATMRDDRMCFQVPDNDTSVEWMTEDCLVLTVYVPNKVNLDNSGNPPTDRLPVLIWMYGGFFFRGRGTDPKSDARWLSQEINAVVVNINYRVGPLGFLVFEENGSFIEGNQGLKDQQLAFHWVQDNIAKFGGDPDMVTLFGNSAGAQSIMFHLVSAKSSGLFKRAIMQSNPAVFPYHNQTESLAVTDLVLKTLGCRNPMNYVKCLREADAFELTSTRNEVMLRSLLLNGDLFTGIEPFRPHIDGREFPDQPLNLFQQGAWQNLKEAIVGTTEEEMSYVSAVLTNFNISESLFKTLNRRILGTQKGTKMSDAYISMLHSEGLNSTLNDYSEVLAREITDMIFVCPNRALARFASQTSCNKEHPSVPVYLYNDAYAMDLESCQIAFKTFPYVCGTAFHSSEVILVFKSDINHGTNFTENDKLVSDMFSEYWSWFARSGNPTPEAASPHQFTEWPGYASGGPLNSWKNIRMVAPQSEQQSSYNREICDIWDEIDFYVTRDPPADFDCSIYVTTTSEVTDVMTTVSTTTLGGAITTTTTTGFAPKLRIGFDLFLLCLLFALFSKL